MNEPNRADQRVTPSISGVYQDLRGQLGSGAVKHVRILDLAHPQHRGRRVAFGGVEGAFCGFVETAATAVDAAGNAVAVSGPQRLSVRDARGDMQYLDFTLTDTVTLIG